MRVLARLQHIWLSWVGWPTFLMFLFMVVYAFVVGLVPRAHVLVCDQHAGNPEHVLVCVAEELSAATQLPVLAYIMKDGKRYTSTRYIQQTIQNRAAESMWSLPSIEEGKELQSLLLYSWENCHVFLAYGYRDLFTDDAIAFTEAAVDWDALPVRYPEGFPGGLLTTRPWPALSVSTTTQLFQRFCSANPERFGSLDPDSLAAGTARRADYHLAHLLEEGRTHRRVIGVVLVAAFVLPGYVVAVWRTYRTAHGRYVTFRLRGHPVPRPSLRRCLLSAQLHQYATAYDLQLQRCANDAARERSLQARKHRRQERQQDRERIELQALDAQADRLAARAQDVSPDALSLFDAALTVVRDDRRSLVDRRNALWEASGMLAVSTLESTRAVPIVLPAEPSPSITVKDPMRKRRNQPRVAVQDALESEFANGGTHMVSPMTYDDFVRLLDLRSVLPPHVDHDHVAAIVLAGFLHPSQGGRIAIGKRYHPSEFVFWKTRSKLGSRFDGVTYAEAIDWLRHHRIIIVPKERAGVVLLSLNPHARDATATGKPVVERIVRFSTTVLATH